MKSKNTKAGYSGETGKLKKRHFKRIPDTPENIAKAALKSRRKKKKKPT